MITGTVVNTAAVVAGTVLGLTVGKRVKEEHKDGVIKAMGLAVIVLGIKMAFEEHDFFPVIVSIVIGTFIGELADIEGKLEGVGERIKKRMGSDSSTFVLGFVTASVLFCVGSLTIIGCIKDGLMNDPSVLYVKSLLDGVSSMILASMLGVGVIFSAVIIFVYQGLLSLLAFNLRFLLDEPVYMNGISVVGGVLIVGIGISMTGIMRFKSANMLPALFIIPLYDYLAGIL
ncbi:DUF554 domain-containing protein [Limisalsivibrio acetivorans]|uniref:DUF554 domain-containing protein n=1 Tax=Limisalsivibrio acetivorans TaxID=1304888 RepID=UPI0003B4A070|nr:DUF554 domain-containing protein [Limisalsivibrio acetivorans]